MESFPLKNLLVLYSRAHSKDVYINNFQGFKLLVEWLAPIEQYQLVTATKTIPWCFHSYEIQEIARILQVPADVLYTICIELYINKPMGIPITMDSHNYPPEESLLPCGEH